MDNAGLNGGSFNLLLKSIWSLQIQELLKFILWAIFSKTLPVMNNLSSKFQGVEMDYPICGKEVEEEIHLFFHCDFAHTL